MAELDVSEHPRLQGARSRSHTRPQRSPEVGAAPEVSSLTREQAITDFKSFPRGCLMTAGYPFSYAVSARKTKRTENQDYSKRHARFLNC